MPRLRTYSSDSIDVHYDVARCIHAEECVRGLRAVFDPTRRPWIDPEQAEAGAIASVIHRCPTGALHYTRRDGGEESVPTENTATVTPAGPLYLRGDVALVTEDGSVLLRDTRVALCRCGLSAHKPFCDNRHLGRFAEAGALGTAEAIEDPEAPAALTVTLQRNGPLVLRGPVTLTGADGATFTTTKCSLCRCGQSANKPFCDGTHEQVGFEAPGGLLE